MSDSAQSAGTESAPQSASSTSPGHAEGHEDIEGQIRVYFLVFGALAVLTVLTVAVAYLDLSIVPAVIIGLSIATVKGGLVAGYFMHLISEKQIIYVLLAFTVFFAVAMLVLMFSSITVHRAGVP